MRLFLLLLLSMLFVSPLKAQESEYNSCLLLAKDAPEDALKSAEEWAKNGGGDPAQHCQALAYVKLKRYEEAAAILEKLAESQPVVKAQIGAELYAQAAQSLVRAGRTEAALNDQGKGLKLRPDDVDLRIDRAMLLGSTGQYFEALDDLNIAQDHSPDRADIYILIASAYRSLEQYDLAKDALEQAMKLNGNDPLAFLERGLLKKAEGNKDGAKADFEKVLQIAPHSPSAEAAEKHLQEL